MAGAPSAATSPREPLVGLVVTPAGNPPEASLAVLDPVELRPLGASVRLGAFYPGGVSPFVLSPDRKLAAVARGDTVWVVDLARRALVWTTGVRPPRRRAPTYVDRLSWPSQRRLIAASVASSALAVLNPVARTTRYLAVPELVDARETAEGLMLVSGRLGEPLRIVSVRTRRRVFTLTNLWRGIEPKPSGSQRLPPVARDALDLARDGAAADAEVLRDSVRALAVVPAAWRNSTLECPGRLGQPVTTMGYRVLVSAGTSTYDYRVALRRPREVSRCMVRPSDEIDVPTNNLLRSPRAATHVLEAALAVDRDAARAFVVTSGGILAVLEVRSGRTRYRKLRPAVLGARAYRAAHVSGNALVASGGGYQTTASGAILISAATGRGRRIGGRHCAWSARRGAVAVFGWECDGVALFDTGGRRFDSLSGTRIVGVVLTRDYVYASEVDRDVHVVARRTGRVIRTRRFDGALLVNP